MNSDALISVNSVSKKFCRSLKRSLWYGLTDLRDELLFSYCPINNNVSKIKHERTTLRSDEFWAVRDISFTVHRGESLGLIGRNGAGKSTLLRMINGLIKPDTGLITIKGKVAALIALGTGFNPILTGRENIMVSAAIHGLSTKKIRDVIDDIVDFSEIGDFIDSPVQSYSSGMQVRLGFAIATAVQPDIMLLDEVLSVGDARFRAKCNRRLSDLKANCATIVVNHNHAELRRVCDSAIYMKRGKTSGKQDIDSAYNQYHLDVDESVLDENNLHVMKDFETSFAGLRFSASLARSKELAPTDGLEIFFTFESNEDLAIGNSFVNIIDDFDEVHATIPLSLSHATLQRGISQVRISTGPIMLSIGKYYLHVYIDSGTSGLLVSCLRSASFQVSKGFSATYSSHLLDIRNLDIVRPVMFS